MEIIGIAISTFIVVILTAIFLATFFMWLGAKIAGVKNVSFGKSFLAAVGTTFVTWLISLLSSAVPSLGGIIGFSVGLLFSIFVIKGIYDTSFGRALLVWIFQIVAEILAIFIGFLIFGNAILKIFS